MKKILLISGITLAGLGFSFIHQEPAAYDPVPIAPSKQRLDGNPQKGYEYLVTGDYVKGGIPLSFYPLAFGKTPVYLERSGNNKNISHDYTAVTASNGEILVAPNCLQCHAQVFDGKLHIGLGNTFIDFAGTPKLDAKIINQAEMLLKRNFPQKHLAASPFLEVAKTIGPYLTTEVRGVNAADRLAAILVAHRDPQTFKWLGKAQVKIPEQVIPTDTPPWWLLKKKNAMFYNGFGRGDFGKFLMASNLLTVNDTSESREVDSHMPDMLAYIYSLEPPPYPKTINQDLAKKGKVLFEKTCADCHGTYGKTPSYPNLLIPEAVIKTDSLLYTSNYSNPQFVNWFNKSWFTTGNHPASLVPFRGYIAPPLDGIWVTAPYLHNGSVPSLDVLLNSKERPKFWSRNFDKPEYDYNSIGWKYKIQDSALNTDTYNTTLPGYGNYGHTFGDKLKAEERKAVIEYLKTL